MYRKVVPQWAVGRDYSRYFLALLRQTTGICTSLWWCRVVCLLFGKGMCKSLWFLFCSDWRTYRWGTHGFDGTCSGGNQLITRDQSTVHRPALEKGDLLACAWIAKGTGTVRLHHHIKPNHVYVVADVLIEKNCDEEPVAFTLKMLDLATRCGDPGMQRTFWVEGKDIQHSFNRLSVCHTSTSQLDEACQEACHRIQITNSNAGGCLNFPTFHKNSMFRISLTSKDPIQDPQSLAIIVSQQDARHLTNGHEISYPQLGVAVLCQDVVKGVENDSSCTRNRRTILKQTAFSSKRDVSVICSWNRFLQTRNTEWYRPIIFQVMLVWVSSMYDLLCQVTLWLRSWLQTFERIGYLMVFIARRLTFQQQVA